MRGFENKEREKFTFKRLIIHDLQGRSGGVYDLMEDTLPTLTIMSELAKRRKDFAAREQNLKLVNSRAPIALLSSLLYS